MQQQVSKTTQRSEPRDGHVGAALQARPDSSEEKHAKRVNPIKRKQMQNRAQELEEEISGLESAIARCEASLQTFVSAEETTRLTRELDQHRTELQERIAEWSRSGKSWKLVRKAEE